MSKQRQRQRAAREAQEAKERARKAAAAERAQKVAKPRPARPEQPQRRRVYRQRRFPPLPWRLKLALVLGWATVAALVLVFVPTWTGRLGFLVIATFTLPLIVVLVQDPTRRTR